MTVVPKLLGPGVVTVCKPLGAKVMADREQLGARVTVWET